MSTAVVHWPSGLPDRPAPANYAEPMPKLRIEGDVDLGPPKQRRYATAGWQKLRVTYDLTLAQCEVLYDFFRDDLGDGTLTFMGFHPRTGAQVKCQMTEPEFSTGGGDLWSASFELRVLVN